MRAPQSSIQHQTSCNHEKLHGQKLQVLKKLKQIQEAVTFCMSITSDRTPSKS